MGEVRYSESIEIGAPPEEVWAYRLDFENLPVVNPGVTGFERVDGGTEPGVGATYSFTVATDYGTVPCRLTVVEAEPGARVVDEMDAGLKAREVCTFTPTSEGTAVELTVAVEVPDDLDEAGRAFIEQAGRKPVRLELENMKRILEGARP